MVTNNVTVASGQNEHGYYGSEVKFGGYTVARTWTMTNIDKNEYYFMVVKDDGTFTMDGVSDSYGVSSNGMTFSSDILKDMTFISVAEKFAHTLDLNTNEVEYIDCLIIGGGDENVYLCPDKIYF